VSLRENHGGVSHIKTSLDLDVCSPLIFLPLKSRVIEQGVQ